MTSRKQQPHQIDVYIRYSIYYIHLEISGNPGNLIGSQ